MRIYPVILCGGAGKRLWPLSRKSMPKQFVSLIGESSLFQQTINRCTFEGFMAPTIVTSYDFRFIVAQQLAEISVNPNAIILEPQAKNTAPAVLAAASFIFQKDCNAKLLFMPSDHYIDDNEAFNEMVNSAERFLNEERIVTFGVTPDKPEVNYGYIKKGKNGSVEAFFEKPNFDLAKKMIESGDYLWNSGIFFASCKSLLAAGEQFISETMNHVNSAVSAANSDIDFIRLNHTHWRKITSESIDYAVLEKATNLSVVTFSSHWSDLGSWPTLAREMLNQTNEKEPNTNVIFGNVVEISTRNSLLWSNDPQMVLSAIGLDSIIAIAMADAVLVAHIEHAQEIKNLVDKLKLEKKTQADQHSRDYRPWGWFECLIKADGYQVKRLCVYPGERLSLQSHQHRSEHWISIVGSATVQIDEKVFTLEANQSTYIQSGKKHRLSNETEKPIFLIEVQTGKYLGEDDIIRFDDIYNRNPD